MRMNKIKVAVNGAYGRMGREVSLAVLEDEDLQLSGAFDLKGQGEDIGEVLGRGALGVTVQELSRQTLLDSKAQVVIDFTVPGSVMGNIELALACGVHPVVGTTGISQDDLKLIARWVEKAGISIMIAPNFALGAVLMMRFASIAARFLNQAEIIELHHDQKVDAPSGTSLKTAEMISANRSRQPGPREELIKLPGTRGGTADNVHIHSVRLQGLLAHQEVIFGGLGETLTIRHDSYDRKSFMPGIIMAVKRVQELRGVVYGLENILEW
jgi:4-hydroxy-tetrahydrodipicolinate reductase